MIRVLITILVIGGILLLFGANEAAHSVFDWGLTIVKWIFIIGAVILVGVIVFSRKK